MIHETFDRIFLDHSGMIGYICDTQNYELLYMTQAAMQLYDMADAEEYRGRPCYSILHGLEAPCPFCTNDKLSFEHEHRWSHYNEKLGRWFGSTDRLLMLDGHRCRLQVSKDITMRKEQDILSASGNITMEDVLYRCIGILAEEERSLTQLADVAKEVGKGNLNVEIDRNAPVLVGVLADVLSQTIHSLKWSIDRLNQQTVQDPLTGVKNKRAWQNTEKRLNGEISEGTAEFAIAVCDINGLKTLNDTMGHEAGDELIIRASRQICNVFQHSPVYRIGGDEFAVILEGSDLADCEKLLDAFYAGTPERQEKNTSFTEAGGEQPVVSIALGFARYEGADMAVSDVFQRADEAMYLRKASMKAASIKKAAIKEERS